jgi:hypothetical protein
MAELIEEQILITVSRVAKKGEQLAPLTTPDLLDSLGEIVSQLVDQKAVVEVQAKDIK